MERIPNLDTLRFIAAFLVVFQHVELYKSCFLIENNWSVPFFRLIGNFGVVLFFTLSAFLITTILLKEKEKHQVSFKRFYLSRILRIWPLYYLIIFLGFFVFPNLALFDVPHQSNHFMEVSGDRFAPNIFLYLTGFSHLGRTLYGNIAYVSQTWSLGTEQVFYLVWPFVIMYINKRLIFTMFLIALFHHVFVYFLMSGYTSIIPYSRYILSFVADLHIHCMAIGGIFAVMVNHKSRLLKFIFNPLVFYFAIILVILFLFFWTSFNNFDYDVYALLFGVIISNLAFNAKYSICLENKITNYLGSISYGIYMYHSIIIVLAIKLGIYINLHWIIYPVVFIGSILLAHISYRYFERCFLTLKTKPQQITC